MVLPLETIIARLAQLTDVFAWFEKESSTVPTAPPASGRLAQVITRFGLLDLERSLTELPYFGASNGGIGGKILCLNGLCSAQF
ncbi:unnamed protein product [Mycetohabitans rhizoxinica HKI 454]|uniref:Uncharacterized protein n=1 Tax=Mycetohabitans rhizoxinica (strain DSM 19002 / CIP 109453 / HKI 454) TaxID=882378 RepID=E5ARP5_MYCRK|nr:unnamed protein product [Mycetohabitans rhizoxinica HKI 454]